MSYNITWDQVWNKNTCGREVCSKIVKFAQKQHGLGPMRFFPLSQGPWKGGICLNLRTQRPEIKLIEFTAKHMSEVLRGKSTGTRDITLKRQNCLYWWIQKNKNSPRFPERTAYSVCGNQVNHWYRMFSDTDPGIMFFFFLQNFRLLISFLKTTKIWLKFLFLFCCAIVLLACLELQLRELKI